MTKEPVIERFFPAIERALGVLNFSLKPPKGGSMQFAAFLHSVFAFQSFSMFFPAETTHFRVSGFRQCASADTLEVAIYLFVLPGT
jgi:hypothetical protein